MKYSFSKTNTLHLNPVGESEHITTTTNNMTNSTILAVFVEFLWSSLVKNTMEL